MIPAVNADCAAAHIATEAPYERLGSKVAQLDQGWLAWLSLERDPSVGIHDAQGSEVLQNVCRERVSR
ncbi:hypothetical protein Sbs19_42410 [Sphingobium sp. BS19]|jgi:hypothetical protein|nr:hypothetical protein Sbs19_42410 [Sphingobium sp. BS19]